MAGIGFQLERMARNGGVGGFASAAFHGAVISCGPWMLTILAVMLLQVWTGAHTQLAARTTIQTIMVYSFSASVVIAAPFALIGVRLVSDLIYSRDRDHVPAILLRMLNWATVTALAVGFLLFGLFAGLPPMVALLAVAILILLTQIAVTGPFLTTTKRQGPILLGYMAGIAAATALVLLVGITRLPGILVTVSGALVVTHLLLLSAIRSEFPAPSAEAARKKLDLRPVLHVGLAGLANALALWIDKWMLWWAPTSMPVLGSLRVNPVYDTASFLGLLTLIPGLSLLLVMAETRLERVFARFASRCTGTAKLSRIEEARRDVSRTILRQLRLLIAMQIVLATVGWVLTPELFMHLGLDPRGIFSFRFTVVGAVFHLVAIYCTIVLSYYDLFGRIVAVWLIFAFSSLIGTLAVWQLGFAGFGWGYMIGALAAAVAGLAMVGNATVQLIYLMFVGNNPSVVGEVRYWA